MIKFIRLFIPGGLMNSYNSSLTNTYSDRQPTPLSRSEHTAVSKENRPVSESVREGQQLRGEIINRTTTDVTIRLSNGQTLQARLDVSVPLSIGQTASFEVTHADPALISLRILQDESAFAQNALIQKALTAAELPVTSRNAELVNTLLQHNLPISKESILSLIRQSNAYPNADINTLALLAQHKLPVTQATLTQFEAYQNYEHQILPQLANLAHSLSELATSSDSSLSGLSQILHTLLNQTSAPEVVSQTPAQSANTDAALQNTLPSSENTLAESAANSKILTDTVRMQSANPATPAQSVNMDSASSNMLSTALMSASPDLLQSAENTPADTSPDLQSLTGTAQNNASSGLVTSIQSPEQSANIAAQNRLPSSENTAADTTANSDTLTNTMQHPSTTSEVLTQASPQDNFVQQLLTRWTLSPKELADPDKVKDFYRQLRKDLAELQSALDSEEAMRSVRGKDTPDSPLERLLSDTASATGQLQDNLEFMNMLNRIFPYVQLPIRFSDKTAHGELYVYTKKEKLRHESGSISVLLHLDMEALGPTDIYLSLSGSNLSSRFYLNEPEQESLFTEHLPELKETLASKGFDTSFELISRRQEEDPVREFLSSHDSSGLSRFTFDCRA